MRTYVITGGTGHTGKPIALSLLEKGHKVRIISRSAEKAKELTDKGAELFIGDSTESSVLIKAFSGADAAYLMVPFVADAPDYTSMQLSHVKAMEEAIRATRLKHGVTLSSIGAHLESGGGVVQGLQKMEESFNSIPGFSVRHLRASYFMENTLGQVMTIRMMGVMASPVRNDLNIPMVATKDIAAVAAMRLNDLGFTGHSYEYILGQRDITYDEVASIYGSAIGKPDLKYVTASFEDARNAMMMMGMGASVTGKMLEFVQAMHDGKVLDDAVRTRENTTPTSIEEFSLTFKYLFEQNNQQA